MGLSYLVLIALDRLINDPLAGGAYYPGDLMLAVLRVPPETWKNSPPLRSALPKIKQIAASFFGTAENMDANWKKQFLPEFRTAFATLIANTK